MPGVPVLAVGWGALGVSLSGPPLSFSMVLHPLGSLASVSSHSGWCLKVQIWKLQSLLREKPESHIASLLLHSLGHKKAMYPYLQGTINLKAVSVSLAEHLVCKQHISTFPIVAALTLHLGLERKLTFSSPVATAEFSKFAGILSAALSQHHLLGFEIAQLEFYYLH